MATDARVGDYQIDAAFMGDLDIVRIYAGDVPVWPPAAKLSYAFNAETGTLLFAEGADGPISSYEFLNSSGTLTIH